MKRWRIPDEVLNNVIDGVIPYNYEERFYLWPIPHTEIDKSQGELEHNPDDLYEYLYGTKKKARYLAGFLLTFRYLNPFSYY
ncbi:hypothetical protein [Catalinimonas niigatensis]|uniref:hypothetical protein n=1 Tax=Catalinimonas niigatensis TaxID=1397264 RepID=UPI002666915F|nr:hypothetical protein [Catalinimonas niigatensis]WPP48682.1 hypothetical protein PZB72_18590 [Catalinimonas niigatensis]